MNVLGTRACKECNVFFYVNAMHPLEEYCSDRCEAIWKAKQIPVRRYYGK